MRTSNNLLSMGYYRPPDYDLEKFAYGSGFCYRLLLLLFFFFSASVAAAAAQDDDNGDNDDNDDNYGNADSRTAGVT